MMKHPWSGGIAIALAVTAGLSLAANRLNAAVPVPARAQDRPIALVGGTIHTVSGATIPQGIVLFDHGRIIAIGTSPAIPSNAERVDVSGKHIYPALIDPFTHLGLTEIDAVRATLDIHEVGNITPNVCAQVAVNPESELIPVTRSNGVLLALVAPAGDLIAGTSAVLMLDGWTWQDMTLRAPTALHIEWPAMALDRSEAVPDSTQKHMAEARDRSLKALREAFDGARAYMRAKNARGSGSPRHPNDQRWEAMIPVLERKVPVVIEADELQQIEAAVAFAAEQKIRMILYGGYDAPRCAGLLKRYDVPVIVSETHRMPLRRSDAYDDPFTVPERLREAGIDFCIACGERTWNERNLPYQAATAVAYGLPEEEALKSITLYSARILGVADRVGSIEVGKDATLIVTDGDPLEIPTHVEQAYIQGRRIDLNDRQKTLFEKYKQKYNR
jgi:imidazolonepropionase-like amidohydrolase